MTALEFPHQLQCSSWDETINQLIVDSSPGTSPESQTTSTAVSRLPTVGWLSVLAMGPFTLGCGHPAFNLSMQGSLESWSRAPLHWCNCVLTPKLCVLPCMCSRRHKCWGSGIRSHGAIKWMCVRALIPKIMFCLASTKCEQPPPPTPRKNPYSLKWNTIFQCILTSWIYTNRSNIQFIIVCDCLSCRSLI